MAKIRDARKDDIFKERISGRDIPVLTLDQKWYRLLDEVGRSNVKPLEDQLNELLKRQGQVNNDVKDIKKLKKRLMEEIVELAGENDKESQDKIAKNKNLVEECNKKLEAFEDDIIDLPREIESVNRKLMLLTMEHCYDTMQEYTDEIEALDAWVINMRKELKKNMIRKQEMEAQNNAIYAYMHDLFGADVVDIFDMKFKPEE